MSSRTLILSFTYGISLLLGTVPPLEAMLVVKELEKPLAPLKKPTGTVPAPLTQEDLLEDPEGEEPRSLSDVQRMLAFNKLIKTQSPFDMALVGEGYFMLMGPDGNILYSRDGSCHSNNNGILVNGLGLSILDERQTEISVKNGIKIDLDGTIRDGDENVITRLGIVEFQSGPDLIPVGNCLFMTDIKPLLAKETFVHQGYLEPSTLSIIEELSSAIKSSGMNPMTHPCENDVKKSDDS